MKSSILTLIAFSGFAALLSSCQTTGSSSSGSPSGPYISVSSPQQGAAVSTGFAVTGVSRTFESNVQWKLAGQNGAVLARGYTRGGGVDGPAPFRFTVNFHTAKAQSGSLTVYEEDVSDGEGKAPPKVVIPLKLKP